MKLIKILSLVGIYALTLNAKANISASAEGSTAGMIAESISRAPRQIYYHFVATSDATGSTLEAVGGNLWVTTASPALSSVGVFTYGGSCYSQLSGQMQWQGGEGDCGSAISSAITVSLSTVLLLKEEMAHVEVDAYAFLAGEELTLALEAVIEKAINEVPQYAKFSDQEVVLHLMAIKDIQFK